MRVHYTLPGMQPSRSTQAVTSQEITPSFKSRLRRLSTSLPLSWKRMLRLDQPTFNATLFGPPPRPPTLELKDAASERLRWRNLLERQSRSFVGLKAESQSVQELRSVQRMLNLLLNYQRMEDAVIARHLTDSRG